MSERVNAMIRCIDQWLEQNGEERITAVEAAALLEEKGLLNDSPSRPGAPLRKILRDGKIAHAYQEVGGRWFIPHSKAVHSEAVHSVRTQLEAVLSKIAHPKASFSEEGKATPEVEDLIRERNFRPLSELTANDIPDSPGMYAIRIQDPDQLPDYFAAKLKERKDNLLYIGIASRSLRKRFWGQELHAQGHGTFFRTIGAVLGYLPPKGSLKNKGNKRNYTFSYADEKSIITWMENSLLVNYIELTSGLEDYERTLIVNHLPLLNLRSNPAKLEELERLRKRCVDVANE